MKKLARREQWLALIGGLGLAAFVTFWLVQGALDDLKKARTLEKSVSDKLRLTKKVLGKREDVAAQLEVMQRKLPRFGPDRDVTAEQMRTLDRIAQEQNFGLGQREPQAEGTNGIVREIVIHSAWDSNLDALTHFLYALQTQDVIFDVRRLTVMPVQGVADRLKGSLVINSAYEVTDTPSGTNTTATTVAAASTNAADAVGTNIVSTNAASSNSTNAADAVGTNIVSTNTTINVITNMPAPAAVTTTNQPGIP